MVTTVSPVRIGANVTIEPLQYLGAGEASLVRWGPVYRQGLSPEQSLVKGSLWKMASELGAIVRRPARRP
jgi:hypothetical protein